MAQAKIAAIAHEAAARMALYTVYKKHYPPCIQSAVYSAMYTIEWVWWTVYNGRNDVDCIQSVVGMEKRQAPRLALCRYVVVCYYAATVGTGSVIVSMCDVVAYCHICSAADRAAASDAATIPCATYRRALPNMDEPQNPSAILTGRTCQLWVTVSG